jgi:hypothetical protein
MWGWASCDSPTFKKPKVIRVTIVNSGRVQAVDTKPESLTPGRPTTR